MTPVLTTPPAAEPISLAEAKAWLRIDSADEDSLLAGLIAAARMTIERQARRLMITQGWRILADTLPATGALRLPLSPVSAVTAIRIYDAGGVATVLSPTVWRLEGQRDPPLLHFAPPPPQPGRLSGGVEIDLTCGYGAAAAEVPEPLRHAVRLLLARWYERRGDDGGDGRTLPPDIALLLAPFRAPRLA